MTGSRQSDLSPRLTRDDEDVCGDRKFDRRDSTMTIFSMGLLLSNVAAHRYVSFESFPVSI